jgi:zinc protease
MTRWSLALVMLSVCLSCGPAPRPTYAIQYAERRGTIESNGLRFVIAPDRTSDLVEVDVRYEVGAREDPPGKAGLAHLVEHLMFQLRPDGPAAPPLMQYVNALSTSFNAYTNWDSTHYMTTARAEVVDALLKIEAMRLFFGCQTISEAEFLREREVVRNEIRSRSGGADGQIPQRVLSAVYPAGHPYARMIGGTDQQLASITLADACAFIRDHYVTERATVIVAGDVDVEATAAMIQRWFGRLERRAGAPLTAVPVAPPRPGRVDHALVIDRPVVVLAWPLPAGNTPDGQAVRVGVWNAFSGAVRTATTYELATSMQPALLGGELAPVFAIVAELDDAGKVDDTIAAMRQAAQGARRGWDTASAQDLEEIAIRRKADFVLGIEPLPARTDLIGHMVQFDRDVDFGSDQAYLLAQLGELDRFEPARVGAVMAWVLDPANATVLVFTPGEGGAAGDVRSGVTFQTRSHDQREVTEVDPAEAARPLAVPDALGTLATARTVRLSNGMKVVLLPVASMPVVAVELVFAVGDAHGAAGVADAAARLLTPAHHVGDLRRDALLRPGIGVGCASDDDRTTCTARGVSLYLDVMLRGLERLVVAGSYDQETIDRWQRARRERLAAPAVRQRLAMRRQVAAALYGAEHPYARDAAVTGDIGYDEVNAFRRRHYVAANATLVVAGNFDAATAEATARAVFGGWDAGTADAPVATAAAARTGAAHVGVIGKAGPQASLAIAYPAPAGVDGREAARRVLVAMLNQRVGAIRHRLGATYGVYAQRTARRGPSAYVIGGEVDSARAGEVLAALRAGIDGLRAGEGFDVDFVRARRRVVQDLLGESMVSAELASRLAFIAGFGLDGDHYRALLRAVATVTPAEVKALMAAELAPAGEVVVALADRPTLQSAFAAAGIADARLVEATR